MNTTTTTDIATSQPKLEKTPTAMLKLFDLAARSEGAGILVSRLGMIIVLLWIGALKACKYEADGIVPFVANSPFMSFLLADPGNYKTHRNPEGALVLANREWNRK